MFNFNISGHAMYAMEKEDATVIKVNHMPDYLDATEIWYRRLGKSLQMQHPYGKPHQEEWRN